MPRVSERKLEEMKRELKRVYDDLLTRPPIAYKKSEVLAANVERILRKYVGENEREWDDYLDRLMEAMEMQIPTPKDLKEVDELAREAGSTSTRTG